MTVDAALARGRLLAVLGVGFGLAVTIGNAVGAGILRTPSVVAGQLPAFWPFVAAWTAGAAYALLGANALAELGTLIPRSGGQYAFVREGLGDYPAFVVGWSDWVSTCGTTAAVAIVVGEFTAGLVPALGNPQVTAFAVVAVFTVIQWIGIRSGSAVQGLTSLIKAAALLLFIVVCVRMGARVPWEGPFTLRDAGSGVLVPFFLALQSVIYTYDGWSAVVYFSGEVKDSARSIPRAMIGSVITIGLLYLLVNAAFLSVVSLPEMAGSTFAAGLVMERLAGPAGAAVLSALVVLMLLSAVSSNVLMAPRVLFAMAQDRLFWRRAQSVNRGGTPDVALLISSVVAAAFILTGTFESVIARLSFFFVANYTLSFVTLFVLRRRAPAAPRPYRAWGHPATTALALVASVAFLAGAAASDPASARDALGLLLITIPVYLLSRPR